MNTALFDHAWLRRAVLPAALLALSGPVSAFDIETGNPDLAVRWDNTFRYNAAWRMSAPKTDLLNGAGIGASETKFKEKGDMITNRIDVLSEFDFIYKESTGFRVSAAGWYDKRYDNHILRGSATSSFYFNTPSTGAPGRYPDEVTRYYNGPSGEFLDAFVFHQFNVGDVPIDVKLGQHTVYWGETLFSLGDGVSAGQSYADLRKALSTPGIEAKELFKPLNQFSWSAAVSPELVVMGQYFFAWKPDLFPLGGTYYSPADFLVYQGTTCLNAGCTAQWWGVEKNGVDETGDWGIGAKWHPKWLDGTAGFYYRKYTPKNALALATLPTAGGAFPAARRGLLMDPDLPRTKLYGFSLGKQVWGISWGMDLTYRKDANLNYRSGLQPSTPTGWAPYGDIYTATLNMIAYDGKRGIGDFDLYDSATLTAELDYDALSKVTYDPQNLFNVRRNCSATGLPAGSKGYYGCATGQSYGINIKFEPKWFQVFPEVDLTMPLFYGIGLKGNSMIPAVAQNEGQGSFSIGVTADVSNKYNFALNYVGSNYKRKVVATSAPGVNTIVTNASLGDYSDRGRITFTAKATW